MNQEQQLTRGPACAYSQLGNMSANQMLPVASGVMGSQTVPVWSSMGYDSLTHGKNPGCGGHFSISNAYPDYDAVRHQCSGPSYIRRQC